MASKQIKKNQVVWAKLKGYPWWPSCVSTVGTTDVVVNFLGENTHATIKLDQVYDFKENYSQYIKNVNDKNKKLKQAVAIGLKISEGKASYEDERKNMERKYQMEEEEEEEATNQTSSEDSGKIKKQKKGVATTKNKAGKGAGVDSRGIKMVVNNKKAIKATSKSTSRTAEAIQSESKHSSGTQQTSANSISEKMVPENAGEPSQAASEKDEVSNSRQVCKKQQKINEKQTRKNQANAIKIAQMSVSATNQDSGVDEQANTEQSNLNINTLQDKETNSAEQFASLNNQRAENTGDKSPIHLTQLNETGQNEEEEYEEEMNLEKATKKSAVSTNASPRVHANGLVEDKREVQFNTSDSNLQSSNGQGAATTQPKPSKQSQRNKRASQKNGALAIIETANNTNSQESPKKKIKSNGFLNYYSNPSDASELQINLENILEQFQNKKNQSIFKLNEMKELDRMCDLYFNLNVSSLDFIKTSLGKVFLSSLLYVSAFKHNEDYNPEIKQKLDTVVENIRDKVLNETLGPEIKELMIKKKLLANGNGIQSGEVEQEEKIHSSTQLSKQIAIHTKLNGEIAVNAEKDVEDPKKLRDQQLRKKICKKINELLKENYGLEKAYAQDLCVQIERKIKSVQVELNHDYKNNVKGLIRLLKAKEISIERLQKCNVDELIQIIQHENIQADLKTCGVPQFEKNSSAMIDNSD